MAKKIMLLPLIFFFFCLAAIAVHAKDKKFSFSEEEQNFAKEIAQIGKKHGMIAIREKHKELKHMIGNFEKTGQIKLDPGQVASEKPALDKKPAQLKIFVSSSMSEALLKQYVKSSRQYGATLIFCGLPKGSFRALSKLVYEITDGEEKATSLQIDDTAFEEYRISNVPSFVLVKESSFLDTSQSQESRESKHIFDKVTGNIGIRRALKEISENGELFIEAKSLLNGANVGEEADE